MRFHPILLRAQLPAAAILCFAAFSTFALAADVPVPRWEPHDFAFKSSAAPENPFRVAFSAEVLGPDGVKLSLPGFYDGAATWKVRVSASTEGAWSLVTHSDVAALDGQRRAFVSGANRSPEIHGTVRIDGTHPH